MERARLLLIGAIFGYFHSLMSHIAAADSKSGQMKYIYYVFLNEIIVLENL